MRFSFVVLFCTAVFMSAVSATSAQAVDTGSPETPQPSSQRQIQGDLTLDQAIEFALRLNPSLDAGTYAVSAAEARVKQAGLLPNPEFLMEAENFGGSDDLVGYNAAETTIAISQPILLGGKRKRRRAVAESEHTLVRRDLDAVSLDVILGTTSTFYLVITAQEREALADDLLGVAERFANTVQARVDAGKVSPVEAVRAKIEVAQARSRLGRAVRELEAARIRLAASWGSSTAIFDRAVGRMPKPTPPPTVQHLRPFLAEIPEIARLDDQIERQQRVLEFEQSLRVPDLAVNVGPRRFQETGQIAWVAGISLPIPIFDRNQGARQAAGFELERSRRDAEAARIALEAELTAMVQQLDAVAQEASAFEREIVPAATEAFAAIEMGYQEGKFGFLDVLDAQRALFEARSALLDSLEEYSTTRTVLERLIGRPLGARTRAAITTNNSTQGEVQ